jgi:hypothetical protein
MKLKIIGICIIISLFIFACGCVEEEEEEPIEAEKATVSVQVTDEITDTFKHVNVTFSEVRLFYKNDTDEDSFETIMSDEKTIDLIELNLSKINATLGVAEIEVGNYSKLWIHVTEAVGFLSDTQTEVNITVPSGWLKIQQLHLFNITKGNHTITVDIDLEHSIHTFHGGEEYKFVPVISSLTHKHENQLKYQEKEKNKLQEMEANHAPAIDITVNDSLVKNKVDLDANVSYEFNASGTYDEEGDALNYTWSFGDGIVTYEAVVTHTYEYSNTPYTVTLTVYDGTDESVETFKVHINNETGNQGNG